jgi:hypothetical protein
MMLAYMDHATAAAAEPETMELATVADAAECAAAWSCLATSSR